MLGPSKDGPRSRAAATARRDGWDRVWLDTCCIDKSSSAELSEAINSMFDWYAHASVCYAYLEDVTLDIASTQGSIQFMTSRWFRRGWTLQELLAPSFLYFVDSYWNDLGTRTDRADEISAVTGISGPALLGDYMSCNIATKFAWAAKRDTTRAEDEAYCLLGLFGINMPLVYGQGKGAFRRLRLELIKDSTDESIFAWPYRHFRARQSTSNAKHMLQWPTRAQATTCSRTDKSFWRLLSHVLDFSRSS